MIDIEVAFYAIVPADFSRISNNEISQNKCHVKVCRFEPDTTTYMIFISY
jgi:hypothetical protein